MKIVKIEVLKLALPMKVYFETSFGKIQDKKTVLVKLLADNGLIGYGESAALDAPLYTYETTDTCIYVLKNFIGPTILNREINHPEELTKHYPHVRGHNFAKNGIECAIWHLFAQEENKSLSQLLGGNKRKIPVGESLGIKTSLRELLEEVGLRLKEGYRRIKVKIRPGWDIKVIKEIRNFFGDIDLMVDANSAYRLKDISIFKKMDEFNLTMIEQPLAYDDIVDHATLQQQIETPICLDESIFSAEDARKAIEIGACKIINIKPGRVGGLLESMKIHNLCKKYKIGVWCGGMLETGIGRAFNIALASLPNFIYPADMSPAKIFYREDLIEPTYDIDNNGFIAVSQKPGLGYDIREDRIKKYTLKKIRINNKISHSLKK